MSPDNPLATGYNYINRVSQDIPEFEEVLSKSPGAHPFDIEDALDGGLFNKDELVKYGYFKSAEQKVHSEYQILSVGEIKVGRRLFTYHHENISGTIKIKGEPQPHKDGTLWVPCEGVVHGQSRKEIPLDSFGLVPYKDGFWNAWNWLSRKKVTKTQVKQK